MSLLDSSCYSELESYNWKIIHVFKTHKETERSKTEPMKLNLDQKQKHNQQKQRNQIERSTMKPNPERSKTKKAPGNSLEPRWRMLRLNPRT